MIRRTRNEWLQIIEDQNNSHLTATEFCKNKGIDPKYFSLKKAKLKELKEVKPITPFVKAHAPITTHTELSLSWAGADIHLPADTSPIWLAQLIRELVK